MLVQIGPSIGFPHDEYSRAAKLHPEGVRHEANDEESCNRGDHLRELCVGARQGEWKHSIEAVHDDCLPARGGHLREACGVREFHT